jgi:hypothetical protein
MTGEPKSPIKIGMEILPLVLRVEAALLTEPNPVKIQQAIEIVTARWAAQFSEQTDADFVADSIHKHVRQIMKCK